MFLFIIKLAMHHFRFPTFTLVFSLCFFVKQALAQNLLQGNWKFSTGDNLTWSKTNFNDHQWKIMDATKVWEEQGYKGYDGFAWYRLSFVIPSTEKSKAIYSNGFTLNLEVFDDADEIYFNGNFIASHGKLPPESISAWNAKRVMTIPNSLIHWDKLNTVAVRIYDNGGNGGLHSNNMSFTFRTQEDNITISSPITKTNRVFSSNFVTIPININNAIADKDIEGLLQVKLVNDFGDSISLQEQNVAILKNTKQDFNFKQDKLAAGFYKAMVQLKSTVVQKEFSYTFAVKPEQVIAKPDGQKDFIAYWETAKQELATVQPKYKLIKLDSLSNGTKNMYLVEMFSLDNVLVRGYLIVPKKKGKYPAVLQVHGYSGGLRPDQMYSGENMIAFGLNIRGHGVSKDDINHGFPGFLVAHLDDKMKYPYRGAYLDCSRAVDFLYSLPQVDTSRVMVEGSSQGGALSIATAALNPHRIKLCAPSVPFLSDFPNYFKVSGWPTNEFNEYVEKNPQIGWDKVYQTLSYIDIKNLSPLIKCPVYMTFGMQDDICPPRINFAAYNNIKSKKQFVSMPLDGHAMSNACYTNLWKWVHQQWNLK
jgi:cephalosporin-C deacetylase